jgi:hypothetical protein
MLAWYKDSTLFLYCTELETCQFDEMSPAK